MRKSLGLLVGLSLVASPALAQIRPQDCRPVFPVMDKLAQVTPPQDVVTEPAAPQVAAKKRFLGLPFLLPALAAVGGCAAFCHGQGDGNPTPVSPA